ncbi:MAG: hypothetical protein PVJ17_00765 [Lysobacterales bacterium]
MGPALWLAVAHLVAPALGVIAVLYSNIARHWAVVLCGLIVLVGAAGFRRLARQSPTGRLRLFLDGTATLVGVCGEVRAVQHPGGWVTRWICVLPLVPLDSDRLLRCVVCRSLNRPGSYRRLMAWLRLRSTPRAHRWTGASR